MYKYAYFIASYVIGYFLFSWALDHCVDKHAPEAPRAVMTFLWIGSPLTVPLTLFVLIAIGIFTVLAALL